MSFFKKREHWREVFLTTNMTDFFKAKNVLSENGIKFKDTTGSNMQWLLSGRDSGRGGAGSRNMFITTVYKLSVPELEEERARFVLEKAKRSW